MKQYTINFDKVSVYSELYECVIKSLEFPDWCGKNADAIWDLLTGYAKYPAIIVVIGAENLPKELEDEYKLILTVFQDLTDYYKDGRFKVIVQ